MWTRRTPSPATALLVKMTEVSGTHCRNPTTALNNLNRSHPPKHHIKNTSRHNLPLNIIQECWLLPLSRIFISLSIILIIIVTKFTVISQPAWVLPGSCQGPAWVLPGAIKLERIVPPVPCFCFVPRRISTLRQSWPINTVSKVMPLVHWLMDEF